MNDLNNKIEIASKLITESKKVIVMTGAGISVDSGVPTFQGTEGLWARFGKPKMNEKSIVIKVVIIPMSTCIPNVPVHTCRYLSE